MWYINTYLFRNDMQIISNSQSLYNGHHFRVNQNSKHNTAVTSENRYFRYCGEMLKWWLRTYSTLIGKASAFVNRFENRFTIVECITVKFFQIGNLIFILCRGVTYEFRNKIRCWNYASTLQSCKCSFAIDVQIYEDFAL